MGQVIRHYELPLESLFLEDLRATRRDLMLGMGSALASIFRCTTHLNLPPNHPIHETLAFAQDRCEAHCPHYSSCDIMAKVNHLFGDWENLTPRKR